jgi:cardiolipin synthase
MSVLEAALSAAEQRVQIMTPYFLPPLDLLGELRSAALRGVHVTLLLPALNNIPVVHWAAQHILGELLAVGVDVRLPAPFCSYQTVRGGRALRCNRLGKSRFKELAAQF